MTAVFSIHDLSTRCAVVTRNPLKKEKKILNALEIPDTHRRKVHNVGRHEETGVRWIYDASTA
jgi:hypothetical protein